MDEKIIKEISKKLEFKGELKHIEPYRLIKEDADDPFARFFLVLAVIYNDLKGLALFEKLVIDTYRQVEPGEISVHAGEIGGVFTQIGKLFISNMREFFDFLKENEDILSGTEFKEILLKINNKDIQNRLKDIIDVAFNKSPKNSDFTKHLILIRNNIAFHYDQSGKELEKSFCNFFHKKRKIGVNDLAYYSVGETMEDTRFFYADAAVQEYMRSTRNDRDKLEELDIKYKREITQILRDMNFVISRLLKAYLKNRPK